MSKSVLIFLEILSDCRRDNDPDVETSTLGQHTIVDWMNFFRDVCAQYLERHSKRIGGVDTFVEIDETCVTRRKYERDRLTKHHQWIFGGVVRGTFGSECFMVAVRLKELF